MGKGEDLMRGKCIHPDCELPSISFDGQDYPECILHDHFTIENGRIMFRDNDITEMIPGAHSKIKELRLQCGIFRRAAVNELERHGLGSPEASEAFIMNDVSSLPTLYAFPPGSREGIKIQNEPISAFFREYSSLISEIIKILQPEVLNHLNLVLVIDLITLSDERVLH